MRRSSLVACLTLLTSARLLTAQQPASRPAGAPPQIPAGEGEVRGTVVGTEGAQPIARASVSVRTKKDSVLVTGAIADAKGTFRVQGLRPGAYVVRVTSLGYAPQRREIAITAAAPKVDLATIALTRVAVTLASMNVVEERAAVAIQADRNAYRAKDIAPAAANASEVLEQVPSVQVDADGKVSLRGNENVAVQINGRPSPLRGPQLASFLKTLPANVVAQVEVIPNPSAKYDPEGMAGILNIVLKQNVDLGLSGGANVGAANTDRFNASGNIGYQSGPWTTFTALGINNDDRVVTGVNDRERLRAGAPTSFTNQDVNGTNGNVGFNLNQTVDRKFGKKDVLSTAVAVSRRRATNDVTTSYEELNAARSLLDEYDRLQDQRTTSTMYDLDAAFKHTYDPKVKHELSAELRFNRNRDDDNTSLWRQPLAGGLHVENERDVTAAVQKQFTGQVDYTKSWKNRRKLELGAKTDERWLDRDYGVRKDSLGTGHYVNSALSNVLGFDERVQAAYAVVSQGVRKVDVQAGLRGEYASRDFSLAAQAQHYPYHYTSFFPSGALTFNQSDATQWKASYSRRIRRPGTQELNPFPSFFDVQNVMLGNPKLNPEYTDAVEFGYLRSGKLGNLQVSPFYRRTTNVIRVNINTADKVDGRDVTTISFKNLATSNSWGTDVNGTLRLGRKVNVLTGFNIFKMVTDGGSSSLVGSDAVTWMTRANVTWNVRSTTTLQGNAMYRAPMNIEGGRFASQQALNFVLRQKVDGDKAAITVRVLDPFDFNRFKVTVGDDNLTQRTLRSPGIRAVFLGYQYNFGRPPRIRQPEQQQQQSGSGFPG